MQINKEWLVRGNYCMNHFKQMNMYANKTITMQKHNNLTLAAWRAAGQIRQTDLSHHAARNAWNCKWRRTSFRFYRAQIYPFGFSSHASNERVWCIHKRVTGPLLTSITPAPKCRANYSRTCCDYSILFSKYSPSKGKRHLSGEYRDEHFHNTPWWRVTKKLPSSREYKSFQCVTCGDGNSVNSQPPDMSCSPAVGAVPLRRRRQRGHRHRRQGGCRVFAGARPSG